MQPAVSLAGTLVPHLAQQDSVASLAGTKLINSKKEVVTAGEIWNNKLAIVYLVAKIDYVPEKIGSEAMKNVKIVAIGSEKIGFEDFMQEGITKFAEVYVDESQTLHSTLSYRFTAGEMLKAVLSPSAYVGIWNSKVKGNLVAGTKPYYHDSLLVIGRDAKILHQQTLKDTANDKFDIDAVVKAAKAGLI